jgi:hypothetical protein
MMSPCQPLNACEGKASAPIVHTLMVVIRRIAQVPVMSIAAAIANSHKPVDVCSRTEAYLGFR